MINIVPSLYVYSGVPKRHVSEVVGQSSLRGGGGGRQPAGPCCPCPGTCRRKAFSDKLSDVCDPRLCTWAELSLTEQVCLPNQGVKYLASPLVPEERQDKGSGRSSDRKGVFHTNKCELISLTCKANVEGPK